MNVQHIEYNSPAEALAAANQFNKNGTFAYVLQGCIVSVYK